MPLDVVTLGVAASVSDVGISSASLPPVARVGEQLKLFVSTTATAATAAQLTIRNNGRLVISQQVQVQAGAGRLDLRAAVPDLPAAARAQRRPGLV